ncbi:MAG: folylpolyglutamate synthase/dihydrofolate synthase family protein [Alphaproteobacteria bacterium]
MPDPTLTLRVDDSPSGSDRVLTRLMALHPKLIDMSLDRTVDLLNRLDRPQDRLPPVVHVAGTNGKGSTIAALRAIAEAAGYRVHAYTSPHLARFHERIRLAGSLIEEEALIALLEQCEQVNENRPITFFEITTCAAFKAFAEVPADLLLLETGLGGRLDSTNVVARPAATAITPISMDHTQFLGDTLSAIAGEKAAIQKSGTPSVVGPQVPEVLSVIDRAAEIAGAPLLRCGVEWGFSANPDGSFRFQSAAWTGDLPAPALPGAHQSVNAATAVCLALTLRDQGFDIPDSALSDGVATMRWPARLQTLTRGPIFDALPGWDVVLDGGHNAAAGEVLAGALDRWKAMDGRPVHVLAGMLNSKAAADFLRPMKGRIESFTAVAIPDEPNSFSAGDLCGFAQSVDLPDIKAADGLKDAVEAIARKAGTEKPPRLLICGSLYLAGRILQSHG